MEWGFREKTDEDKAMIRAWIARDLREECQELRATRRDLRAHLAEIKAGIAELS